MQALFEIKEISQPWKPPFEKTITVKEVRVGANEGFDSVPHLQGPVFKLLQVSGDRALVEYHRDFTPKGYEQPQARQFWFKIGEMREFSHLWGDNGTTKKLTFKGIQGTGGSMTESESQNATEETVSNPTALTEERPRPRIIEA